MTVAVWCSTRLWKHSLQPLSSTVQQRDGPLKLAHQLLAVLLIHAVLRIHSS